MVSARFAPVLRAKAMARQQPRLTRSIADLTVLNQPNTSKQVPITKAGPSNGGRSAVSGHTVAVFGCTGFLGRYIVSKLAKEGTQVIVPYRDEDKKRHLKVTGDLGVVVPLEWDARNPDQIHECVRHSDTVYNLTGLDWETRNYSYEDVNVKTAGLIAEMCAQSNVDQLIHVSHLNANPNSPSRFYRTKYEGERAVRSAFPDATIVRPGPMYGAEDWLLNAAARYPALFKLNGGNTKMMPVHVLDVAKALKVMLDAPVTSVASTFHLAGPAIKTGNEILDLVSLLTMKPMNKAVEVPKAVALAFAGIVNKAIWWPTVSPDEIERKFINDAGIEALEAVDTSSYPAGWAPAQSSSIIPGVDGEPVKTFADLGINPDHIEEWAIRYVRRYRSSATYDMPVELGHFKKPQPYHTVP